MDADTTATFAIDDTSSTEQIPALTVEQTLFDQPLPIPPPMQGEPAYLVEVRPPHRAPSLLAIRATLPDAIDVATTVHPAFADVTIRELALPCDVQSLERAAARKRVWNRTADGQWFLES